MKKNIFFGLFVILPLFLFSQNKSDFTVSNFIVDKPFTIKENAGITYSFDLKIKNFEYKYYLSALLMNEKNENINLNSENELEITAYADFDNKNFCTKKGLEIFIPYELMNCSSGTHEFNLIIVIKNKDGNENEIFTKQVKISKPELFDYSQQQFTITNLKAFADADVMEMKGLKLNFNCKFLYSYEQIKGLYQNEKLADYYFYFKIIDQNSKIKYFPVTFTDYEIVKAEKEVKNITLFVPYNDIDLQKGKYDVDLVLEISNSDQSVVFNDLVLARISFNQPQLYLSKLEVYTLKAKYYEYDTPSIFGQVFKFGDPNRGLGYADIFWSYYVGKREAFSSSINKNSFTAFPGKTNFIKITDADKIYLYSADYDALNANDKIGNYAITNLEGEFVTKKENISFDMVETASFIFSKMLIPYFTKKTITATPYIYNQTSGTKVTFDYDIPSLEKDFQLFVKPVMYIEDKTVNVPTYLNLENNTISDKSFVIQSNKKSGKIEYFIPYFLQSKNWKPGFEIELSPLHFIFQGVCADNIINPVVNDVRTKIEKIEETQIKNQTGVKVSLKIGLPELYTRMLSKNELFLNFKLENKNENKDISNIVKLYNSEIQNINKSPISDNDLVEFFVPYSQISKSKNKLNLGITTSVVYNKGDVLLGIDTLSFTVDLQNMITIHFQTFETKIKETNTADKYYWIVSLGDNSEKSEFVTAKNLIENSSDFKINCLPEDMLNIELMEIDKFGLATTKTSWLIAAKDFVVAKNALKLDKQSDLKKTKILFKLND